MPDDKANYTRVVRKAAPVLDLSASTLPAAEMVPYTAVRRSGEAVIDLSASSLPTAPGPRNEESLTVAPTRVQLPVVSLSAEYLVMGYLMRRNILVYKAPPFNEGYDLI